MDFSNVLGWRNLLSSYTSAVHNLVTNYNALKARGPYIRANRPAEIPAYDALVRRGDENLARMRGVNAALQSFTRFSQGVTSTAAAPFRAIGSWLGLGEVGAVAVPVVAIASLGAAVAAVAIVSAWVADAQKFTSRLNMADQLIAGGSTPAEAARAVNALVGPPPSANTAFGLPWELIVFGALAFVLGPPILKMMDKRQ